MGGGPKWNESGMGWDESGTGSRWLTSATDLDTVQVFIFGCGPEFA